MKRQIEGSQAVAEAVRLCRPQVIAAYPITPQTHIVERLAQMVADGDLVAEYISFLPTPAPEISLMVERLSRPLRFAASMRRSFFALAFSHSAVRDPLMLS